ncbi:hypothetical protein N7508_007379, partial [Penicillium antarcticum]|uniref:uncharacterized protein n=1 Tax=Penicillium antarcticum TaxID=416450 RepID=UPI0023891705
QLVGSGGFVDCRRPEANPFVKNDDDKCDEQHTPGSIILPGALSLLSTRESWARLRDRGYHVPQDEPAVTDSTCDLAPCRLICDQSSDCNCSLESISCAHLEEEESETAKSAKGEEKEPHKTKMRAVIGRQGPTRDLVVNATVCDCVPYILMDMAIRTASWFVISSGKTLDALAAWH